MKRLFLVGIVVMALSLLAVSVAFGAATHRQKSGLNYIDLKLVQPGYPLVYASYLNGGCLAMIDLYGNLVHNWNGLNTNFNITPYPVPLIDANGVYIAQANFKTGATNNSVTEPLAIMPGDFDAAIELDWNSNLLHNTGTSLFAVNYAAHHDLRKIWNKALGEYTYLALGCQAYKPADAVALGTDPVYDIANGYKNGWSPDSLLEVDQDNNLVWRWSFADHVVQNYDATKTGAFIDGYGYPNPGAVYGQPADFPGKLNINILNDNLQGPCRDWNHCNSIDYNPALGHVVINAKHFSEIYVVDHDSTFVSTTDFEANWEAAQGTGGDFIYRFGNPKNYGMNTKETGYRDEGNHQFFGAHNIHWIGESSSTMYLGFGVFGELQGEGHMMIFDNNCWNPNINASVILEWNPFVNADGVDTGAYVDPPAAGYVASGTYAGYSKQVVWKYEAGTSFYGNHISGCQRQPNGNTHVCSGTESHLFEVTMNGALAWEYFPPNAESGYSAGGFGIFRSNKLPVGHAALEGRDLTPKGNLRDIRLGLVGKPAANELKKFIGTF